jgi:hypothetical protein
LDGGDGLTIQAVSGDDNHGEDEQIAGTPPKIQPMRETYSTAPPLPASAGRHSR